MRYYYRKIVLNSDEDFYNLTEKYMEIIDSHTGDRMCISENISYTRMIVDMLNEEYKNV